MKNTLSEQIKKLQQQNGLPTYVKRKRDFPFVTEGEIEKGAQIRKGYLIGISLT